MPQFAPDVTKLAIAPITVKPAGMSCEAELFLGPDDLTKVATSGRVPFVSTGTKQNVRLPINMPSEGTYHGYIDVFASGMRFLAYKTTEDIVISPAYKVDVSFERVPVCASGHMEGDKWVCTEYFPNEREGISTVTNKGDPGHFTTTIDGWIYRYDDNTPFNHMFSKEWADYFEIGQAKTYTFRYMVGVSGMPLDSRFFIKVYDPNGKIIADRVFIRSL